MISNPFGKKPDAPKKPWGNENPYRIFGVNEEAPYEEVERAFKELVAENEGNEKYIMQLEMMKEDIFDQRLTHVDLRRVARASRGLGPAPYIQLSAVNF